MLWLGGFGIVYYSWGRYPYFDQGIVGCLLLVCLSVEGIRPEIMACGAALVCMQPRSPGCGQGFRPVGKIEKDAWFCRWHVVSTILNAWAIVGEVGVLLYLIDDGVCWINMGQLDVWWNDGGSRIDAQMIG